MKNDSIVFHGNLQQLLVNVETGEMTPRLPYANSPSLRRCTGSIVKKK